MHNEKNENGYALIIVLLVIIIIAIITPSIISKIISGSIQFQKVEEDLQIEKLGYMGILYTEKAIDEAKDKAQVAADDIIRSLENLTSPTQADIDTAFLTANEAYKDEFKRIFNIYFADSTSSCDTNDVVDFNCKEVEVKDEFYKYKVEYNITILNDKIDIQYYVFMKVDKVNKNYNNSLPLKKKTINIPYS